MKESVKLLLIDKIKALGLDDFYSVTERQISGLNGTQFFFAGLRTNPQAVRSVEGIDIAWVEEANYVSSSSLQTLTPSVRKKGAEIWYSWNPRDQKDPVDAMFRGGKPPPRSIVRKVNWDSNPWFDETELRDEMEWDRDRDPEKYAHVWLGEYVRHSEARVFRNWRIDALDVPNGARPYYGADWGFSIDPSVLIRCYVFDRTLYIDREAYKVGCEIDRLPMLFDKIEGAREWPITADSARPDTIEYMGRQGFRISGAAKGPGSIEDGVEFLKSHDIVVHPDCRHTIDELTLYSYKQDKHTKEVLPVLEDKDNNVIDALRYAVEGIRRLPKPVEFDLNEDYVSKPLAATQVGYW